MVIMCHPPLLYLENESSYKEYYQKVYCRGKIHTFDGIRVYFKESRFGHAFYETPLGGEYKSQFSNKRAERIDWIKATLENPKAELYKGWDRDSKKVNPNRRVSIVYEDFVVIIDISKKKSGIKKAEFITAFTAGKSLEKIRNNPRWEP